MFGKGSVMSFNVTVTAKASGTNIFQLPTNVRIEGKRDSAARPLLHRVAANLANLCALSAQRAVIDHMGKVFNIRVKTHKDRAPSFIQNQVKILNIAKPKDFPNITVTLEVQPFAKSSDRTTKTPLFLSALAGYDSRDPVLGPRTAIPVFDAREGGTFKGKVKRKFRYANLNLTKKLITRKSRDKRPNLRSGANYRVTGKYGTYKVEGENNTAFIFQRVKGENKAELLYTIGIPWSFDNKMFKFFEVAKGAIAKYAQAHFERLVENLGDDRQLKAVFAPQKRLTPNDGIPF